MRPIFLFAYNVLRLLTWPALAAWWRVRRQRGSWVVLHLQGSIEELSRPPKRLLRLLRPAAQRRSVSEVRLLCERLARDEHAQGLLLRIEHLDAGHATLASLRTELLRLRERGKQVVCYLPIEASQRELYVAAAADRIVAMPHAGLSALGPLATRTFLSGLLGRLGIGVSVSAEGRFKSAADALVRESMSAPEREQLTAIVRVLHDDWVLALSARPRLGSTGAHRLLETALFGAQQAQALGVVDDCLYDDRLLENLGAPEGEAPLAHDRYLRRGAPRPRLWPARKKRERVAIVRLVGAISERGGRGASDGIDLHGTTTAFRSLAKARHVTGVILYIDSPGGSAVVSELLHREISRLNEKKPVVTWMGNVAASGGYYLASATRAIIAQPTTLTGSIGVIAIRPIVEQLFAKLGLSQESVSLTPHADLNAWTRAPSPDEDALLRTETARFYARFLEVAAQGRKCTTEQVALHAQGRVWSGRDAKQVGLVDALGGYYEARQELDRLPGSTTRMADDEPVLIRPTAQRTPAPLPAREPLQGLLPLLTGTALDPALAQLHELSALAVAGERVLAYAGALPHLR